ncbi:hypothetical protein V8F06_007897 [Rhypophila decipiens]
MASDDHETPAFMKVPNQIAADFCSLVKICPKRATFDPSTVDHEEQGTTRAQKALLKRLHLNWQAVRRPGYSEPMTDFLTIAKWFAKDESSGHDENKGRSSKSTAKAEALEFPSSELYILLEQIIQVQNERVDEWIRHRKEQNRAFLAIRPNPEAEDDDTLENKGSYYNYRSWHPDYPKPEPFEKPCLQTDVYGILREPDGITYRMAFIERLNRQVVFLEDYEKNKYPQEWRKLFQEEGSGSFAKYWEYWREKDKIWMHEELEQARREYKSWAGCPQTYYDRRKCPRVKVFGFPPHLMSEEEKAKRDANVFKQVWTSVPTWPEKIRASLPEGIMKKDGEKER